MSAPHDDPAARSRSKAPAWQRLLPWLITLVCFAYLYTRLDGAAAREGKNVATYMAHIFASVSWTRWLALMIPYSFFFLLIDTAVLWRVVNWFNARVSYRDLLPVRASTYIISIVNEQVGKGAMAYYLNRREGVPGWQVGSSMLFIMFCEFFYLMFWATVGISIAWNALPPALQIFRIVPFLFVGALLFFAGWVYFFRNERFDDSSFHQRHIVHSFRQAEAWKYGVILLLRSPAFLGAVVVYALAAQLFGVQIGFREMLSYLPIVFFGTLIPGPFRAVAVTLWPTLFPENAGQMAAFGFVQHNFFVLFNAAIGLVFLRRANRELFDDGAQPQSA